MNQFPILTKEQREQILSTLSESIKKEHQEWDKGKIDAEVYFRFITLPPTVIGLSTDI